MTGRKKLLGTLFGLCLLATACASGDDAPAAVAADTDIEIPLASDDGAAGGLDEPAVSTTAPAGSSSLPTTPGDELECRPTDPEGRVDINLSGNRLSTVAIDLSATSVVDTTLPATIAWVVPGGQPGEWIAVLADGQIFQVDTGSSPADVTRIEGTWDALLAPPVVTVDATLVSPLRQHELFDNPLADGRVVRSGSVLAVLADPTDRYGHAVLGDAIEAAAVEWVDPCNGSKGRIDIAEPDVIEGVAPILADVDDDGTVEVVVTLSNSSGGARLVAYELDGSLLAESASIGRGNRWRNQLAVGPFGPEGETEILDVQTPHLGGILQAFQLREGDDGPTLARVAASGGAFTSHPLGSRNVDMAVALDANADGAPDALVAAFERDRLIALTRTDDARGWQQVAAVDLPGQLTSNIAIDNDDGRASIAVGAGDVLRVWLSAG